LTELLEIARALKEEARLVACGVQSSKRRFNRTPEMAALILNEATGGDCGADDLLGSDCRRLKMGENFLFSDDDIIALAERLLDASPVITPAPSRHRGDEPVSNFFPPPQNARSGRAGVSRAPPAERPDNASDTALRRKPPSKEIQDG
jgi:hypothetical protein